MPLPLYIHPCVLKSRFPLHPPPPDLPLRIRIQGPLVAIQRLLPNAPWSKIGEFPQPGGVKLAKLAHEALYNPSDNDRGQQEIRVRDEYLAWVLENRRPLDHIDYYGVTFDHLVPCDDPDPEVLVINIIELEVEVGDYAGGQEFASKVLLFPVQKMDYAGKKVLAVPRCCQIKKGTTDRKLINGLVKERDDALLEAQTLSTFAHLDATASHYSSYQ
ncbi:hypothetical protein A9K55_005463 [Cordyceps militaris]|uniref:Uncharacterized protein n=1 Tax=Cordyceps militaris TaxID=73501 RepID=A0A2H4SDT2_CORMI|nr:hypothetical protein A9K55_005463 [Cordyceps militaris]